DGQLACLYVILYSVERFFVEGLRTDSLYIGPSRIIRQAQLLSVVLIVVGIAAYFVLRKRKAKNKEADKQEDVA
ncbi:MAG TPA: prolipoprotein diacylglyceryl transferase, partial [Treponemataceae bacterium]|nr:prolipoprotein diacylglyceryl transferase [Treponemataceae bacterium]